MTAETARSTAAETAGATYGSEVATALGGGEGKGADAAAAGLTEWQTLIIHLLLERARGTESPWAPYIAALPDQAQHPLMWGDKEMAWVEGSPMHVRGCDAFFRRPWWACKIWGGMLKLRDGQCVMSPLQPVLVDRQSQVAEDAEALLIALPEKVLGHDTVRTYGMGGEEEGSGILRGRHVAYENDLTVVWSHPEGCTMIYFHTNSYHLRLRCSLCPTSNGPRRRF